MLAEAQNVGKRYGPTTALSEVNLAVRPGMLTVLGPNGAGKTTLLRILAGILRPTRGRVAFNGRDIWERPDAYRYHVGYKPQDLTVYTPEPAAEALRYFATLKGIPPRLIPERLDWAITTFGLAEVAIRPLSHCSRGLRQRFFLAQAFLADPDILILDEPLQGLDEAGRLEIAALLGKWSTRRAVVVSTHIVSDVERLGWRVAVLQGGRMRFLGESGLLAAAAAGRVWEITGDGGDDDVLRSLQARHLATGVRAVSKSGPPAAGWVLRVLADGRPHPSARPVAPTLEEGYLATVRGLDGAPAGGPGGSPGTARDPSV